ncbi:uncharacterized protein LOC144745793 [Ciona intestinalis]
MDVLQVFIVKMRRIVLYLVFSSILLTTVVECSNTTIANTAGTTAATIGNVENVTSTTIVQQSTAYTETTEAVTSTVPDVTTPTVIAIQITTAKTTQSPTTQGINATNKGITTEIATTDPTTAISTTGVTTSGAITSTTGVTTTTATPDEHLLIWTARVTFHSLFWRCEIYSAHADALQAVAADQTVSISTLLVGQLSSEFWSLSANYHRKLIYYTDYYRNFIGVYNKRVRY